MNWKAFSLLSAALLLAGCPSPPKRSAVMTRIPFAGLTNSVAPQAASNSVAIPRASPAEGIERPRALAPHWIGSATGWTPLSDWAQKMALAAPRRISSGASDTFELGSNAGRLIVSARSLTASWNGVAVGLGFAPQMSNGIPLLHNLDLSKTVMPLFFDRSVPAPGSRLVVVDPGHGGENMGARCVLTGKYEKDLTLDWARRIRPLLERSGWQVRLTRTNDVDLSLAERVAVADQLKADLFISLHFNSLETPTGDATGVETFCLTPVGMASHLVREFDDDARRVYPNNSFDAENLQLATRIHGEIIKATGRKDRGVRRARFMSVLQSQQRPAVLIEAGFLSDRSEARLIATTAYRQTLADAVARALSGAASATTIAAQ